MRVEEPFPIRLDVLTGASADSGLRIGVSANRGAHTNELIGGTVLAIEDAGRPVRIVWREDGRDRETAAAAAEAFVADGIRIIIGHLSASAALGAAPVYRRAGALLLAPGTSHPDLTGGPATDGDANHTVLRLCHRDEEQADIIADFIAAQADWRCVAVVRQDIAFGRMLADLITPRLMARGCEVRTVSADAHGLLDPKAALATLDNGRVTLISGIHECAAAVMHTLEEAGNQTTVILPDDGLTPNLITLAGRAAERALIFAPGPGVDSGGGAEAEPATGPSAWRTSLVARFRRLLGMEPGAYFLTTYSAAHILLSTLDALGDRVDPSRIAEFIKSRAWATPLGNLRFDRWGDVRGIGWTVHRVENGQFVAIESLPASSHEFEETRHAAQ